MLLDGSLSGVQFVHASARPHTKYTPGNDFQLWLWRFDFYLEEAEIPSEMRVRELLSMLDDG